MPSLEWAISRAKSKGFRLHSQLDFSCAICVASDLSTIHGTSRGGCAELVSRVAWCYDNFG